MAKFGRFWLVLFLERHEFTPLCPASCFCHGIYNNDVANDAVVDFFVYHPGVIVTGDERC
jgi:hypothetical protein